MAKQSTTTKKKNGNDQTITLQAPSKKDLERLAQLEERYLLECDEIRERELEMDASVAWAAIVEGA